MQRIYLCFWSPEEYEREQAYWQVIPESSCANCGRAVRLHRHARYQRWIATLLGKFMRIWIIRFLCPLCRRTMSYLPDFAFTYRVLQIETFEAYLDRALERPDVRTWRDLLHGYKCRLERFAPELIRCVGAGLGLAPPAPGQGLWPWLKKAGKGLRPLTRRLVTAFRIGLFKRYRCHQPAGP